MEQATEQEIDHYPIKFSEIKQATDGSLSHAILRDKMSNRLIIIL